MIRNGLYSVVSKVLDGIEGNSIGVSVVQDGTMRGGDAYFYFVGSYTCSGDKWKGEVISKEHAPAPATRQFARKVVSMGFSGTHTDESAELHLAALVGKQSIRMKVTFRLLVAD